MKIDLVGPKRRGFAMGLNEAAGYLAVSGAALLAGYVAGAYGYRAALLWVGGIASLLGLLLSAVLVRDSRAHAEAEGRAQQAAERSLREVFAVASWRDRTLFSVSQAGMVNNLNDGMAWGLFPLYFASEGLSLGAISILGALYPAVWGTAQLATGALSDRFGRKLLIASGMMVQGIAILSMPFTNGFAPWALTAALLGIGTAMVYPTLLATIGDVGTPVMARFRCGRLPALA
jgi:MFS family permease